MEAMTFLEIFTTDLLPKLEKIIKYYENELDRIFNNEVTKHKEYIEKLNNKRKRWFWLSEIEYDDSLYTMENFYKFCSSCEVVWEIRDVKDRLGKYRREYESIKKSGANTISIGITHLMRIDGLLETIDENT